MKTRRFGRFAIQYCTLFLLLAFCAPLLAVYPEDGMYWDPNDAGRGVYVEVQDETVFIVIFTYAEGSGEAEIYTAAAPIRDDAILAGWNPVPSPIPQGEGYLPMHWVEADLYKVENGPCLLCRFTGAPYTTEAIGTIRAWFDWTGAMNVYLEVPEAANFVNWTLQRQDFARSPIVRGYMGRVAMPDMSGLWLFTDLNHPEPKSWRFEFDERIPDSVNNEQPFEVVFRDSRNDAEWRCAILDRDDREKLNGCELHQDGEILFAANVQDLGVKKITAFRGALPSMENPPFGADIGIYRGPELVIGVRVDAPSPAPETED